MTIDQITSKQIEAYNNRDLEGNMDLFSDDIKFIQLSNGNILLEGKQAVQEMYKHLLDNSPDLFAEVVKRIDFEDKVVLHEYIHGRHGNKEKMEQVIILEIQNNKISKIYKL